VTVNRQSPKLTNAQFTISDWVFSVLVVAAYLVTRRIISYGLLWQFVVTGTVSALVATKITWQGTRTLLWTCSITAVVTVCAFLALASELVLGLMSDSPEYVVWASDLPWLAIAAVVHCFLGIGIGLTVWLIGATFGVQNSRNQRE